MALVFGIEGIPIFETLFVLMILLIVGLVIVFFELKKLASLIRKENVELKRFELDLAEFEKDQGKKPSASLITYVDEAIKKGMNEAAVEQQLSSAGWTKKEIDDIFEQLKD
jgi:hypothetical protein